MLSHFIVREPNLYEELRATRHSSSIELHQAFRKASLISHPDKNRAAAGNSPYSTASSSSSFHSIKDAYDVLIDEDRRSVYNRFGAHYSAM